MPHALRALAVTLPLLALPACRSGLGCVPVSLVDLYDQGSADGIIEMEFDRDGTILEMESDIDPDHLPSHVRDAALARLPGAVITGAEREIQLAGTFWEVKLSFEGRDWELVLDDSGAIRETEKEITTAEAPDGLLDASAAAVPDSRFKSIEIIHAADGVAYHVKRTRGGASYKIVLREDGTVLRKVREARAEIEIPLRD